MTNEPVAYLNKIKGQQSALYFFKSDAADENIPLYTKEQLQPRVKMTKEAFDEWKILYNSCDRYDYNVFGMLGELIENSRLAYCSLAVKFEQEKGQADLARLYVNYNPENPEETIEIV